jgi:hypothetical protein
MSEIAKLDLSHGSIHTMLIDGQPHIVLRPAVEDLGLDYSAQLKKLKTRTWGTVVETAMVAEDGKLRQMAVVPVRTFLMLLATVNENRVKDEARPVLVAFQSETTDAIEAYWTRGAATNPRVVEPTSVGPTTVAWDQAAAIARLQYGLDVTTPELRELLNKGGILTNTGRPHKKWEHLFWPLPTRWEIHASVLPQLIGFAAKVRHQLAAAERDLQMSLPFPISGLVRDELPGGAA